MKVRKIKKYVRRQQRLAKDGPVQNIGGIYTFLKYGKFPRVDGNSHFHAWEKWLGDWE